MADILTIKEAIRYHLEYNLVVPVPATHIDYVTELCVKAVEIINRYDKNSIVEMKKQTIALDKDKGFRFVTRDGEIHDDNIPAFQVIRLWHISQWLGSQWK